MPQAPQETAPAAAARETPQNVVLVGFMGSGKSTVGRLLARQLGFRFVDTDSVIERRAGKPIKAIFADPDEGEGRFRELEERAIAEAARRERQVISTGGGAVTHPGNIGRLRGAGFVVWLDASPATVMERVGESRDRPLLQTPDPEATVRGLLDERRPLYQSAADLRVGTGELAPRDIAYGIAESVRLWFAGKL